MEKLTQAEAALAQALYELQMAQVGDSAKTVVETMSALNDACIQYHLLYATWRTTPEPEQGPPLEWFK